MGQSLSFTIRGKVKDYIIILFSFILFYIQWVIFSWFILNIKRIVSLSGADVIKYDNKKPTCNNDNQVGLAYKK